MSRRKSAFTLVEILLVMALVVVLAALSLPSIRSAWDFQALRHSGDLMRAACASARAKAMRTGQIQMLRVETGAERYYIEPWTTDDDLLDASADEAADQAGLQPQFESLDVKRLPEFIRFHDATGEFDTRAMAVEETLMKVERGQGTWSRPVLFYPDGSTSSVKLVLVNRRDIAVAVEMRGLTGMCRVGEPVSFASLLEPTP